MNAKEILLRAARAVNSTAFEHGCCHALLRLRTDRDETAYLTALGHFRAMFKPRSGASYWFGMPQWMIRDREANVRARQHRVYALLLAAESLE